MTPDSRFDRLAAQLPAAAFTRAGVVPDSRIRQTNELPLQNYAGKSTVPRLHQRTSIVGKPTGNAYWRKLKISGPQCRQFPAIILAVKADMNFVTVESPIQPPTRPTLSSALRSLYFKFCTGACLLIFGW